MVFGGLIILFLGVLFPAPGWAATLILPKKVTISTATVTPELKEEINETLPPNSPPVVKTADLTKSAIGTGYSILPLPAFVYNRNEGAWAGGLLPIFRANEKGEVEDIYAPLYLHNQLIGETFTFNYYAYRHRTTQYHAILSVASKVERVVDLSYKNIAVLEGRYIAWVQVNSAKSAFNRFFGFGNNTLDQTETTYTMGDIHFKLSGGINLSKSLSLIATERYRDVKIENGVSPTLPQTLERFPQTPGIDGANVIGHGLALSYDTRDNQLTSLRGTYATLFGEYDQNVKFGERNHWWRLTAEARQFIPHARDRLVFVGRFLLDAVVGQDENYTSITGVIRRGVPFYERPSLGGETTLRGFGRGRFVGNTAFLINLEERMSLFQRALLGNLIELELAPFIDMGRVGRSFDSQGFVRRIQVNPGFGLRLLARPNIAGRLDLAWGKDGSAVFVGLDYPF